MPAEGGRVESIEMSVGKGRLAELVALRTRLAQEIDVCESVRDLAALARQYRETIREIDEIQNGEDGDDRAAELVRRHHQGR